MSNAYLKAGLNGWEMVYHQLDDVTMEEDKKGVILDVTTETEKHWGICEGRYYVDLKGVYIKLDGDMYEWVSYE